MFEEIFYIASSSQSEAGAESFDIRSEALGPSKKGRLTF